METFTSINPLFKHFFSDKPLLSVPFAIVSECFFPCVGFEKENARGVGSEYFPNQVAHKSIESLSP